MTRFPLHPRTGPNLSPPSPCRIFELQYHNDELYANLYTIHSWTGILVVTLFYANYVGGFFNFFAGWSSQSVSTLSKILAGVESTSPECIVASSCLLLPVASWNEPSGWLCNTSASVRIWDSARGCARVAHCKRSSA